MKTYDMKTTLVDIDSPLLDELQKEWGVLGYRKQLNKDDFIVFYERTDVEGFLEAETQVNGQLMSDALLAYIKDVLASTNEDTCFIVFQEV